MKGIKASIFVIFNTIAMAQLSHGDAFTFEVDINTGYNNNVFLESEDLVINEEPDDSQKSDVQTQMAVTANYEFWDQENSDAAVMVDYFKERLVENQLDTTVTSVSLPAHYYSGSYRYGVSLTRQTYNLSGLDVLNYQTSKIGVANNLGNDKVYVSWSNTNKVSKDESYEQYEGRTRALSAKYKSILGTTGKQALSLQANLFKNDYQGEGLSNTGGYIKAVYEWNHGRHSNSVGAKFKRTQYELDTLTNDERLDRQVSANYHYEYYLSSNTQLYFDTGYINNQSNIEYDDENYNYDQWVSSLGARFVF